MANSHAYGLIGEKLGHSYSKKIHEKLGEYEYELIPLEKNQLEDFIKKREFKGLNVTIPYKEDVLSMCDVISPLAKEIGAVNTLYFSEEGKLTGENTDYHGFIWACEHSNIVLKGKKILVLGDGGTSRTIKKAVKDEGAAEIWISSRKKSSKDEGFISYEELQMAKEAQVIINTTSVGMYPDNEKSLINLGDFPKCKAVFDVIYNPYYSKLIMEAKKRGMAYGNGLAMLVAQATKAAEYFTGHSGFSNMNLEILKSLKDEILNIVLIGMPGSGKTTVGKVLSKLTNRTFHDLDKEIVKEKGMTIPEIFDKEGEAYFRQLETEACERLGKERGLVIATGGGAVMKEENMDSLMQNGKIVFLNRRLDKLATKGRPLSKDKKAIKALYHKRKPLYEKYMDVEIICRKFPKKLALEIIEKLEENS